MNRTILIIVLLVVGLVVGFFGGVQYQKSQSSAGRFGNAQFTRRFGNGGTNNGQAPVVGSIVSQDQNSITVKLRDGSSKIVLLSNSTTYNKTASGSASDLKAGDNVLVMGSTNSDGSVTAQNVTINPMIRFGGGSASSSQQ